MRRGEIWITTFDASIGGEIRKTRPSIIVSNDYVNAILNRVQIVPTSTRLEKLYPSEVLIRVGGRPAKAMIDQISTASKKRLLRKAGEITTNEMHEVERLLRKQLALE